MSDQPINYEAVLADLKARRAQLDSAIAAIEGITGQGGIGPSGGGPTGGGYVGGTPAHDAFIGMSIPEAAKKHLTTVRKKLSTQDLMTAMEAGGLPPSKYSTVYAILRRREKQVGDIINMKGDWALQEWYPNYRKKASTSEGGDEAEDTKETPEPKEAKSVTA
ncbi:MAG: hypothetical protein WAL71_09240 [Terriglobales bacterium]|jgi:hypothetical protein